MVCSLKVAIMYSSLSAGSLRTGSRALGFSLLLEDGRRSKTVEGRKRQ